VAQLIRFSLAHINPAADFTILVLVIGLSIRDCVFRGAKELLSETK
jgi:FMN reductase